MNNFNDLTFETLDHTLRLMLGEKIKLIHSLTERQASPKLKEVNRRTVFLPPISLL